MREEEAEVQSSRMPVAVRVKVLPRTSTALAAQPPGPTWSAPPGASRNWLKSARSVPPAPAFRAHGLPAGQLNASTRDSVSVPFVESEAPSRRSESWMVALFITFQFAFPEMSALASTAPLPLRGRGLPTNCVPEAKEIQVAPLTVGKGCAGSKTKRMGPLVVMARLAPPLVRAMASGREMSWSVPALLLMVQFMAPSATMLVVFTTQKVLAVAATVALA